jgi:hypothetical protein
MRTIENLTFVVAVNDDEVYKANLSASPIFTEKNHFEVLMMKNYSSASKAYNAAIEQARNDLIVFIHQDIYLPEAWLSCFNKSLSYLDREEINWGVLGCYGVRQEGRIEVRLGQVYTTGMGIHGQWIYKPEPVQTLDEIVLVIRKSSGLRFDPSLPYFHLYGTDICMSAREKEMMCYVIPAFCIHNTNQIIELPIEFYECYKYIKRQWKKYLPIHSSCIRISRFDNDVYLRRILKLYDKLRRKTIIPLNRVRDPRSLIDHMLEAD